MRTPEPAGAVLIAKDTLCSSGCGLPVVSTPAVGDETAVAHGLQGPALCMTAPSGRPGVGAVPRSPKIQAPHLERLAVVYVRQSSPQQVAHNHESRERQYALVERAVALGWPRERVRVIDEDQGRSGATAQGRTGFQQLLIEVNLDHVGLILGLEMSRLARSCRDWYHLLEVCAVFRTLLGDQDGVYDPTDINDRLLLGLKGTLSEVELHTMWTRLLQAKWNKARRGELLSHPPRGYVRSSANQFELDPDEQVQATIRLVFEKFSELKSVHAVVRYLASVGVRLPFRWRSGPNRGQVAWSRPSQSSVQGLLLHPMYAGAYCYGRRRVDARRARGGHPSSKRVAVEHIEVLLPDRLPAYISWEQFQQNQRQMAENRSKYDTRGVPRRGVGLLPGLLVCGRCGCRMRVCYGGHRKQPRYMCSQHQSLYGLAACQSLEGGSLDALVTGQVLRVLEPAALELSLTAGATLEQERHRQGEQWRLRLERARYEAERACRQHNIVEPENRQVARELERRWEQALTSQRQLEEEYARWERTTSPRLTASERARIESLARDIPALWHAPDTSAADRKTIVRHLIDHVVVNVEGSSEIVQATIHWAGGFQSRHQFRRRVGSYEQLADYERLLERVCELQAAGYRRARIAEQLTRDGFHPPQREAMFTVGTVQQLLRQLRSRRLAIGTAQDVSRIPSNASTSSPELDSNAPPGTGEWWAADLATALEMPLSTLRAWHRAGWVHGRKCRGWPDRWIYWAQGAELDRLRRLRSHHRTNRQAPYPSDLITPLPHVNN